MRISNKFIAVLIMGLAPALTGFGDTIRLRASVRMPDQGEEIRLADIAELHGPAAEKLAEKIIAKIDDPSKIKSLSVREVRQALDAFSVNWGTVNLNGREVVIRPRRRTDAAPPQAMAGVSITRGSEDSRPSSKNNSSSAADSQLAANVFDEPTLRGAITRLATRRAGVPPSDLRLQFIDAEKQILDTSQEVFRFNIKPTTGSNSDRYGFQVRLWADGRVQDTHIVSLKPLIRTKTVRAAREINRHETISQSDVEVVEHWLEPTQRIVLATHAQAIGRVADSRIRVGELLRRKDIERRTLIERGDRVTVRCLVGGFVVSVQAEARGDGAEGDLVECRKLGERETFVAQVTGPHEAVLHLDQKSAKR